MRGLIMDYQLNVPAILRRAEQLWGAKEIVSRLPDKSFHRYTYADFARRAKQLALALEGLGLEKATASPPSAGTTTSTSRRTSARPVGGFVTHTLNLRLHPDDLTYIATQRRQGADRRQGALAARGEVPRPRRAFEHVVVVSEDGDVPDGRSTSRSCSADADESAFEYRDIDERRPRPCATRAAQRASRRASCTRTVRSPSTRLPRRSPTRSAFRNGHAAAGRADVPRERLGLPVHVHAGRREAGFPGPHLDPPSLLEVFVQEGVTVTAGVPTIWLGILELLDAQPDATTSRSCGR